LSHRLVTRDTLRRLEVAFEDSIAPLLDEEDPEDVNLLWEFRKFLHTKRIRVLTAERESVKKWKQVLFTK
jgi:archaellum biogenesis ATPase FlaH